MVYYYDNNINSIHVCGGDINYYYYNDNDNSSSIDGENFITTSGFLFAFFRFSQLDDANMIQRLVHLLTASDIIHVAVVPILQCKITKKTRKISSILAWDTAYTAFMGTGFLEQKTEMVLAPQYDHMFMPVAAAEDMENGINFLKNLHGASYNYPALPLTIVPGVLKRKAAAWHAQTPKEFIDEYQHHKHAKIFCSQMGLMLCYICNTLPDYIIDPAGCAPGELQKIIKDKAGGIYCDRTQVSVFQDLQKAGAAITVSI
jgi:hypothetical protein